MAHRVRAAAARGTLPDALEHRIDLGPAPGRRADLIAELQQLTALHPLRETLWQRLLTALEQSGRRSEALEAYETIRSQLADELGADPGAELKQIHARLLIDPEQAPAPAEPTRCAPGGAG
ncbi:AfsR/SARP family transcriptional regulator [Phytoactinopolyspora endophytica]|uniref:AfsR/SARP family transcriptional regulator n=1 Tax=Phytoactinopolyspora endophytica TaxID=1642495 RepID=UPI00101C07CA|nr:BTAD domain-containing putative transcriptional regulator [Phytoactinopolyspora endophytica]